MLFEQKRALDMVDPLAFDLIEFKNELFDDFRRVFVAMSADSTYVTTIISEWRARHVPLHSPAIVSFLNSPVKFL